MEWSRIRANNSVPLVEIRDINIEGSNVNIQFATFCINMDPLQANLSSYAVRFAGYQTHEQTPAHCINANNITAICYLCWIIVFNHVIFVFCNPLLES